jgi:hypothetical protein
MTEHRSGLALFAVVLAIVTLLVFVTTLERVNTHKVSNDAPAGTIGIAKPHGPIDRAPANH